MKYTLLELSQTILSSMDSDEINSISDSVESMQVAKVIRTAYFDLISRAGLPEHYDLVNLQASGDAGKPVLMYIPDTISSIKWVKYDNASLTDTEIQMVEVQFLPLEQFLDRMDRLSEDDANVESFTHSVGSNTFKALYYTDRHPRYYTSFDDNTLIFDGFDDTVDTTLQGSKTRVYAKLAIPFELTDTFVPDLDEEQFTLLLNEAKALAWNELKQSPHPKAEINAKRGWTHVQKGKYASEKETDFDRLPYYGRK